MTDALRRVEHALPTSPEGLADLESGIVTVRDCGIRWWARGTDGPALVLVHGGGAHSGWWHPMLPYLDPARRVIGIDLSGHGDSDRRAAYSCPIWADEIAAVACEAAGGSAVVVAHSMGGRAATVAAALHPESIAALVLVETIVPTRPDEHFPPDRPLRTYPTEEAALVRFRIAPGTSTLGASELHRLARQSIFRHEGGWTWKFDPHVFSNDDGELVNEHVAGISCPVVLVQGTESAMTSPATAAGFERLIGRHVPLLCLGGADHHVMLDVPQALAELLTWLPESRAAAAAPAL